MSRQSYFFIVIFILSIFSLTYSQTITFEDDFESYATGTLPAPNWITRFSGQSAQVSEAVSVSGTKSFELVSNPGWSRVEAHELLEIPDYFVYEGYVYINQPDKGAYIGYGKKTAANEYSVYNNITFLNDGKIFFKGAEAGIELQSWSSQTWYKVKVYCDFINLKGKVWIDDILKAEDINLVPRESFIDFCLAGLNWSGSGTSTVYYDDIKIYTYVPPPFEDDFESYATGTLPTPNWITRFSGQSAQVSEAVSVSGTKSFELVSMPVWARVEAHELLEIPDYLVYEGYVYLNQQDKGAYIGYGKKISAGEYRTYNTITFRYEGEITFDGADSRIDLQSWSSQTWYEVKVYCDFINLKGKVWIDNVLKAENINLVPRESFEDFCLGGQNWSGSGTSTVYYDDIKIYTYVLPPEPPVLSEPTNGATGVETDPTLKWNASDSAITYTLEVSKDSSFTTTVFAESGITTTIKKISGLENNTRYYWRVKASASWGDSDWSDAWSFMTAPIPPPEPPVLSEPANGATGVETDPTLKWNASDSAITYTLKISKDSSFTTTVFAESGITTTMKKISGLENNTRYYWRVKASASWSDSDWSDAWSFMTAPIPPPEPPVLSEPANGATGVVIDPTLKWNASVGATSYELKLSLDSSFTQVIFENSGITQPSQKIDRLANNMLYYWHVNASNSYGTGAWSKTASFKTISTIDIMNVVYFPTYNSPGDYSPTDYVIVGLPGASNLPVTNFLTGDAGKHWQVYWDNGADSNDPKVYLDSFDNSSKFNFSIGRAFWLVNKGTWSISSTVNAAAINHENYVAIPLHDGWNLITNPYLFSIYWSVIQAVNSIATPIYHYRGIHGFSESDIFEPYIGYYYDNATHIDSLRIPFQWELLKTISTENRTNCSDWRVNVSLSVKDFVDDSFYFGVSPNSSSDYDILDFRKPRTIATVPGLYFHRPKWDPNYGIFATDIRPEFDELESWDFEVRGLNKQNSQLEFNGIEDFPEHFDVYLIDEGRGKYINLRDQADYDFVGVGDIMKFRVVVGKSEAVQENLNEINLPKQFVLGKNYPNPFNPSTTIPVEIPITCEATLKIYNLLGQEIKTIYNDNIEAGRYLFSWDGNDELGSSVASGVYIIHFMTNSKISLSSKMILMR